MMLNLLKSHRELIGKKIHSISDFAYDIYEDLKIMIITDCGHVLIGTWRETYNGEDDDYPEFRLYPPYNNEQLLNMILENDAFRRQLETARLLNDDILNEIQQKENQRKSVLEESRKKREYEMYLKLKKEFEPED